MQNGGSNQGIGHAFRSVYAMRVCMDFFRDPIQRERDTKSPPEKIPDGQLQGCKPGRSHFHFRMFLGRHVAVVHVFHVAGIIGGAACKQEAGGCGEQ